VNLIHLRCISTAKELILFVEGFALAIGVEGFKRSKAFALGQLRVINKFIVEIVGWTIDEKCVLFEHVTAPQ
jgi:hypothetical protein